MLRIARLLSAALMLAVLPAAGAAQSSPPTAAPITAPQPVMERRPAPTPAPAPARVEPDPWLMSYAGLGNRTARANLSQIDRALVPYGSSYTRLPTEDRVRVRQAFEGLIPRQSFSRYEVSEPQARAIAYLALGPWERLGWNGDCDGPRRTTGRTGCGEALDSMSRDAAWIHSTILSMGRSARRRPRTEELNDLRAMTEHARRMVVQTSGCGCHAAREDAEALFAATRDAVDTYQRSSMPAWMGLGDARIERIARLSDSLERTYLRCSGS